MPKLENVVEIDSPSSSIWNVLTDSTYLPKLYPSIITLRATPPGRAFPGQRVEIVASFGGVKIRVLIQFAAVEDGSRLVSRDVPGGLFAKFEHTVVLVPDGLRTKVKVTFDYSVAPRYLSKVPNPVVLERDLGENFQSYAQNLKEICELLPLPV